MLVQLAIRDIVLIDRLALDVADGLSVLTGETGAGKSILLDSLSLALGGRGDGGLVRHGAAQGQVSAVFDVPAGHPARALAEEAGLDVEGDLILRRVQHADGRTRAFVNDQAVSAQVLRGIGASLVEIHGQHADRALVDAASHRAMLDAFGGLEAERAAVAVAQRALAEARREHDAQRERVERARREADYLRHAAEELRKLAPQPGEEQRLAAERQTMMQAEKIARELADALDTVSGSASPVTPIAAALRRLERRASPDLPDAAAAVRALDAVLIALDEARNALEAALRAARFDQRDLEKIEERLFALRDAARKYDCPADDLAAVAERFAGDVDALDRGEGRLVALAQALESAERAYVAAARVLSASRARAGERLAEAVTAELAPLKLERAEFQVAIEVDDAARGPDGFDRVEFWVRTNPGTRPGPIMKVASGGELARFLLALKVALADRGSAPTLIFDEIDSGVGGAVADAIGRRLARLAEGVQVLAVTHAPQVAARAGRHFLISKEAAAGDDRMITRVVALAEAPRGEEIARMLAGARVTDEARAAARRLLETAR